MFWFFAGSADYAPEPALFLFFGCLRVAFIFHRGPLDRLLKLVEELVCHLAGEAGDQAAAELGQFATDLGLDLVGQKGVGTVACQLYLGLTLGKTCGTTLALASDGVAIFLDDIRQLD